MDSEANHSTDDYLAAEARARVEIDKQLAEAGWVVQDKNAINLHARRGIAVREFTMRKGHGRADYLLFVDREAVGTVEAKPEGTTLTEVEEQSAKYSVGLPGEVPSRFGDHLPFAYESTSVETRFTNFLDPNARSRRVFWFHRPETLAEWVAEYERDHNRPTLRHRLQAMPPLDDRNLWGKQGPAIRNLEESLAANRPRALIQMATGSGKTFTAANIAYRLIKYAGAKRILFLVDRSNLGKQTKAEFDRFAPPGEGLKFTEIYNVQHLTSNQLDPVANVTISTIQRLYSMLRGEAEMDEEQDERSGYEAEPSRPVDVEYNSATPIETFDFIIVDECHRSIYNLWRQVLEYFDAYLVGLTATPSKQTLGFFQQNLVMEYSHEEAVADGVNVDFEVYRIRTRIGDQGGEVEEGDWVGFRDRATRAMRWDRADEPLQYDPSDLDRKVVAQDQIRTVIQAFKDKLFTEIFPGRSVVPKTLIFAKDDSHADDVVQVVREVFGKGNDFAQKITYRTTEGKPEELLQRFRTSYDPRIVVTVDMIATGTDIKPLECVFFMRATKSRTFFEQMKGRGVRVVPDAEFQGVTNDPVAPSKTHFVIVDAIGVTESELNDSQPLERSHGVSFQKLLESVSLGQVTEEIVSSIASRLARLNRQITREDRDALEAGGKVSLNDLTHALVEATDPDRHIEAAREATGRHEVSAEDVAAAAKRMMEDAVLPLASNPKLRQQILDVRKSYEQTIDESTPDEVTYAGPVGQTRAQNDVQDFRAFIEANRDEITALQMLYSVPWKERLTYEQLRELAQAIERTPQRWTPERLWKAYEALDRSKVRGSTPRLATNLISLVRYALDLSPELVAYPDLVQERFEHWVERQRQAGRAFNDEQMRWLMLICEHIATSLGVTLEDLGGNPFAQRGGVGRARQLFGDDLDPLLEELTSELVA